MMLFIVFVACISSELLKSVISCESFHLHDKLLGYGCGWNNQVIITDVAEHECVLRGMLDKSCTAVNYDVQDRVCMRMEVPCPVLEIHQYVHYQILTPTPADGCVLWMVPNDWSHPRMVKYINKPESRHAVARIESAGELLPAKWPRNVPKASSVQNNAQFSDSVFEVLVVKESCSLRWVNYNASSGNPLPPGAILGGHLADGTLLYVALFQVAASRKMVGYYNDETRMGTCSFYGVRNIQDSMEILAAP